MKYFSLLLLFITHMFALQADAQVREMTERELTARSDVIAVGKVETMRSEWSEDRSRILTYVTVAVEEYIKGERTEKTITVVQLGGEVDGVGELYSHTARFSKDEEVAVFLRKDQRGNLRVLGGDQGKYTVTKDRRSGVRMVGEYQTLDGLKKKVRDIIEEELR